MKYSIGELATAGEVGVETIRYYQRRGLVDTPKRGIGIRHYDDEHLRRLRFVRLAQKAGFKLEEIRELLALDAGRDHARALALAEAKIARIDEQIADLVRVRDSLRTVARRCRAKPTGTCPILASFEPASRRNVARETRRR